METIESLLFVTDDLDLSEPVVSILRREGHTVRTEAGFAAGLKRAATGSLGLLILDLKRPDLDGADLCQQLRDAGASMPILILTTRAGETDIVVALDAGADDYMVKPFRVAELLARVRALLRRHGATSAGQVSPITVDGAARQAFLNGGELALTAKEFDLLAVLFREEGSVVPWLRLQIELWGISKTSTSLKTHICSLRRALGDDATNPRYITTVRGLGLRLENEPDAAHLALSAGDGDLRESRAAW